MNKIYTGEQQLKIAERHTEDIIFLKQINNTIQLLHESLLTNIASLDYFTEQVTKQENNTAEVDGFIHQWEIAKEEDDIFRKSYCMMLYFANLKKKEREGEQHENNTTQQRTRRKIDRNCKKRNDYMPSSRARKKRICKKTVL